MVPKSITPKQRTKNINRFLTSFVPYPESEFTKKISVMDMNNQKSSQSKYSTVIEMSTIGGE